MYKFALLILPTLLCIHFGEGEQLQCVECKFTLGGIPCIQTPKICQPGEVCATIKGQSNNQNLITRRDCVERSKCNVNDTTTLESLSYTTSTVCCEKDFCNTGEKELQCQRCLFSLGKIPCVESTVTCNPGEVCATIKGTSGKHDVITRKDCVARGKCSVNDTETFMSIAYSTSTLCCEGNFCNLDKKSGVGTSRFSPFAGLAALLCICLAQIL